MARKIYLIVLLVVALVCMTQFTSPWWHTIPSICAVIVLWILIASKDQ